MSCKYPCNVAEKSNMVSGDNLTDDGCQPWEGPPGQTAVAQNGLPVLLGSADFKNKHGTQNAGDAHKTLVQEIPIKIHYGHFHQYVQQWHYHGQH